MRKLIAAAVLLAPLAGGAVAKAAPELATSNRLDDRRYVAAGTRAYSVGTEAGRFPAMGFHTRGEMGGVWSAPLKLLDGIWLSLDGRSIGPARRFRSGFGYVEMDLPAPSGLRAERVEFAPDGRRALLLGLRLTASAGARRVEVAVDAHSELMSAYPWGETKPDQLTFNLQDTAAFEDGRLVFREQGRPAAGDEAHDWAAVVAAGAAATGGEVGLGFRGPQEPAVLCPASTDERARLPERCDDSAYGKGAGGRLRYTVDVPARGTATLWVAVAGSEDGAADARATADAVLARPEALLAQKVARRVALSRFTRLSLPGDSPLARGIDWSKQNLADSVQVAEDLELRRTRAGRAYGRPDGELGRIRYLGAGWPDYPWLFATDGEYTAFASVALGQFEPLMDHLRALREVSELANGVSGKVVHEVVSDGSVYFGANADPGNTDETVKFPTALALVWRWSGDNGLRNELYPFARRGMRTVWRRLDRDRDGWPEGLGNVEREGMGSETVDVSVYGIRGLLDLADLARARGDRGTAHWAERRARTMRAAFGEAWWMPGVPGFADSLAGARRLYRRHWIGVTPMEAELLVDGRVTPGLARRDHAADSLRVHDARCYANVFGLFHTGGPGCDRAAKAPSEKQPFTINSAVMAVGEGNYGRLARARSFTRANRRLQLPVPDEQPGAMPEIAPAPLLEGRSIDRPFVERPMVLQAWGAYGTAWPVVHQQLGVRPDLGRRRLEVTPQVPPYQPRIAGRQIRLGGGAIDVVAEHRGRRYRTAVTVRVGLRALTLGVTLPTGAPVGRVLLDGREPAVYRQRDTNRGRELTVAVTGRSGGGHSLVVETG